MRGREKKVERAGGNRLRARGYEGLTRPCLISQETPNHYKGGNGAVNMCGASTWRKEKEGGKQDKEQEYVKEREAQKEIKEHKKEGERGEGDQLCVFLYHITRRDECVCVGVCSLRR